jgi:transcriptional regulator with XRE-family HTH domain
MMKSKSKLKPTTDAITGPKLRAYRQALGMTQAELAESLGVSRNGLARHERSVIRIAHPTMLKLALDQIADTRRREAHRPASSPN